MLLQDVVNALNDSQASFNLTWAADMRAIKAWQEMTGEELAWPDHVRLCVWLLERLAIAESVLEIAGRLGKCTIPESLREEAKADGQKAAILATMLDVVIHLGSYREDYKTPVMKIEVETD